MNRESRYWKYRISVITEAEQAKLYSNPHKAFEMMAALIALDSQKNGGFDSSGFTEKGQLW